MTEAELTAKLMADNDRLRAANTRLKRMIMQHILGDRMQDRADHEVIDIVAHRVPYDPDCVIRTFYL